MRGPIDFIIVGFKGNKFDGSILQALSDAIDQNIIALVALTVISKDDDGVVRVVDVSGGEDEYAVHFVKKYAGESDVVDDDDISEAAELLEDNTTAGLLVVEHVWAIPLKEAIVKAGGELITDGRIHPDAAEELSTG